MNSGLIKSVNSNVFPAGFLCSSQCEIFVFWLVPTMLVFSPFKPRNMLSFLANRVRTMVGTLPR